MTITNIVDFNKGGEGRNIQSRSFKPLKPNSNFEIVIMSFVLKRKADYFYYFFYWPLVLKNPD